MESLASVISQEKRHTDLNERNKIVSTCRWHDYLHRKSQGIYAQHRYRLVGELNKNTATSQQNNCKYLGWTIEKQN